MISTHTGFGTTQDLEQSSYSGESSSENIAFHEASHVQATWAFVSCARTCSWFSGDGLHTCWESDWWRRRERDVPYDYDCRVDVAPNETARRRMAAEVGKPAMVVGIDDSEHSFYALQWTLRRFFSVADSTFKLVVVHSKPSPASVVGLAGPGTFECAD
ncbi:hypothetical protein GW17_00001248 [Ensete ventricosum]|nr:hypothetical protein GW17_00001248 [Ensete ventricosum]